MKWPWVSRKKHEVEVSRLDEMIKDLQRTGKRYRNLYLEEKQLREKLDKTLCHGHAAVDFQPAYDPDRMTMVQSLSIYIPQYRIPLSREVWESLREPDKRSDIVDAMLRGWAWHVEEGIHQAIERQLPGDR